MKLFRNLAGLAVAASLALPSLAAAQALEDADVDLGIAGRSLFYYLPVTMAAEKGYFKEEGLNVTISDFKGGGLSAQALVGGSVDVAAGAYEHTISLQAKGRDIRAVVEMGRLPGLVLAVRSDLADKVKSPEDLRGLKVGLASLGSSTHVFLKYLLAKAGVQESEVSYVAVGIGQSVIAAVDSKQVDAIVNIEVSVAALERDGKIKTIVDTRSYDKATALFGSLPPPAGTLYMRGEYIDAHPKTTQAIVNAIYKALKWLETASVEDIVAAVPNSYYASDKALYIATAERALESFSRTGMVEPEARQAALELFKYDGTVDVSNIDLDKTFDDRFISAASGKTN